MTDPIILICSLTGCDEATAREAYNKTEDTVNAVELILGPVSAATARYNPRKRRRSEMTEDEEYLTNLRPTMEEIDRDIVTAIGQRGSSESDEKISHREETAQRNSCVQECQIPSVESEVEIPEIEYQ